MVEDGVHAVFGGTSAAVPHMTGAVALMLQKDPTATADEIRNRVISTTRADGFTGTVPNMQWGYGKLDLVSAMGLMPLYGDLSLARLQSDGTLVKLPAQVVSAGMDQLLDRFYIENSDRSGGIQVRVVKGVQPHEKDQVTVTGTIGVYEGERAVLDSTVTQVGAGTGTVPKPLFISNRSLGGGPAGSNRGVIDGVGLNNIGLLVTVSGQVKSIGTDYFVISDGYGSGGGAMRRDIKVYCPSLVKPTASTKYAIVTGISSLESDGTISLPVIRVRKQEDLVYY
jgi:hypothetical protein